MKNIFWVKKIWVKSMCLLGEEFLGEKFVQEESLGEKYMGEMYVQEECLGEEFLGEKIPFGITLFKMGDPGVPLNHFFRQNLAIFFSRGVGFYFIMIPGARRILIYNIKFHFAGIFF